MNNNYFNNRNNFINNNINKVDKKKKNIFTISLYSFYAVCFTALIIALVSWWSKKETFYLATDEVAMITNDNYKISLYGKTEAKKNTSYVYTSSNEDIITVDSDGVIHSVSEGEAEVTVKSKYSSKKNKVKVYVEGDSIFSVKFGVDKISMDLGEKLELKPVVNNNPDFRADLVWKADNSRIVSIDSSGKLVGKTPGTTFVNVTVRGTKISTRLKVTVTNEKYEESDDSNTTSNATEVVSDNAGNKEEEEVINTYVGVIDVDISLAKTDLNVGDIIKANYVISPSNATNQNVTWASSNESVASVDAIGTIRALKPGTADISVVTKDGNKTTFVTVNVTQPYTGVPVITLNKNYTVIKSWHNEYLDAQVMPVGTDLVWTSNNPSVATVDKNGRVFGWKEGEAAITVSTKDGKTQSICNIRVANSDVKVEGITINKSSIELGLGGSFQLTSTITPKDATNQSINYVSSDPSIASVDQKGNIKALKVGTVTINANGGNGKTAVCTVKVNDIKIKKIIPSKRSILLVKGKKFNLKTSINPSNATNKVLAYSTSNKNVISVTQDGLVTGVNLGTAKVKIKAKDGSGKYANVEIRVIPSTPAIKISNKNYKSYYANIRNNLITKGKSKHMQNFALQNQGKSNEIIYLSGVTYSNIDKKDYEKNKKKYSADLSRTLIVRIPKKQINSNGDNRTFMYINNAGHGQSFDLENDGTIWTNAKALTPYYSDGAYWGNHNGTMRISFKSPTNSPKVVLQVKDPTTKRVIAGTETSVDEANDLISMRAGENVYVYRLSDARKGKLNLLYEFPLEPGNGLNRQGFDINGGFYYVITGKAGKNIVISVYDMYGNRKDRKVFYIHKAYASKCNEEPEGIKIYNNKVFIGYTHSYCAKVNKVKFNGTAFDIGYFK